MWDEEAELFHGRSAEDLDCNVKVGEYLPMWAEVCRWLAKSLEPYNQGLCELPGVDFRWEER